MQKKSVYFKMYNLQDNHDEKHLKQGLDELPGVLSVSVNLEKSSLAVDYDSTGTNSGRIHNTLKVMGYEAMVTGQETQLM